MAVRGEAVTLTRRRGESAGKDFEKSGDGREAGFMKSKPECVDGAEATMGFRFEASSRVWSGWGGLTARRRLDSLPHKGRGGR